MRFTLSLMIKWRQSGYVPTITNGPPVMSGRSRTSLSSATLVHPCTSRDTAHPVRHFGSEVVTQRTKDCWMAVFGAQDGHVGIS